VGGGVIERTWLNVISQLQFGLLSTHKDPQVVRLLRKVRRERRSLLTAYESFTIYSLAKAHAQRQGDMAEVGVFQGCSAKLICEVKGAVPLHLFDTFEGLPDAAVQDRKVHRRNQYACSLEAVQDYLKEYPNVSFYKGMFPASAQGMPERQFSFAHFDVDLYESTRGCLQYFYPRMIPGGVMISHDYSILAGVKKAFEEFLADKPERAIELPSTQCMVIKL
jgi:hypothetical protein